MKVKILLLLLSLLEPDTRFWITDPDSHYFIEDWKNFQKILHNLTKFNDLLATYLTTYFFIDHKNVQVGSESGRNRNYLTSRILIRYSGLQMRGSGSVRHIYGSGTLLLMFRQSLDPDAGPPWGKNAGSRKIPNPDQTWNQRAIKCYLPTRRASATWSWSQLG